MLGLLVFLPGRKGGVTTRRTLETASCKHTNAGPYVLQPLLQQSHLFDRFLSHFAKPIAATQRWNRFNSSTQLGL
jgi:hypothetical protein